MGPHSKIRKRFNDIIKLVKPSSQNSPSGSPTTKRTCNQPTPDKFRSPIFTRGVNRKEELPNPIVLFEEVPRDQSKLREVQTVDQETKQLTVTAALLGLYGPPWQPGKRSAGPAAEYAAIAVAFSRGFKNPFHKRKVKQWHDELLRNGGTPKSKSNNTRIVGVGPNYSVSPSAMLASYRKSEDTDDKRDWEHIAELMSKDLNVSMSRESVRNWFRNLGGKEIADTTSPYLTEENRAERIEWAKSVVKRYEEYEEGVCEVRRAFL